MGVNQGEALLAATSSGSPSWDTALAGRFQLSAGSHTVSLRRSWGWYLIDFLSVTPAALDPAVGLYFEAGTGTPAGAVAFDTGNGSPGDGYVTNFTGSGETLALKVNLALPGPYRVYLGYRSPYGPKNTRLYVNGEHQGEWTLPLSSASSEAGALNLTLPAGVSEFVFQANWGYYDLDFIRFEYVEPAVGLEVEAEKGSLFRALVGTDRPGFSGSGYVTNFVQAPDATATIPVNVATGGPYRLVVRAPTPYGPKQAGVRVNGVNVGDVALNEQSETFRDFNGPVVFLRDGLNFVTIAANWGYYEVDSIRFAPHPIPPFTLNPTPLNPHAAPEVRTLYAYLVENFGKVILSDQSEEATAFANRPFAYLEELNGTLPALRVQDMIFQSSAGGWNDGTTPRGIAWHRARKGIISMQWHWFAPIGPAEFYTDRTAFDIEKVITPGTPEHAAALVDIDLTATQLGQFAANRVPILWRPLHEAEGGWFWWGAKGPEAAKALYRLLYDRLVNYHGLNNLIWVWNSKNPAWYPGDDVVDIVSVDIYNLRFDYSPAPGTFIDVSALGGYRKLVATAENGPIPDPDTMVEFKTLWSWLNTWNGGFIMDEENNTHSHILNVYDHEKVIALDELPDLRAKSAAVIRSGPNYTGSVIDLPPGNYTQQSLATLGVKDGVIGSLQLAAGLRAVLYSGDHFTGKAKNYAQSTADLAKKNLYGPVRSIRVLLKG